MESAPADPIPPEEDVRGISTWQVPSSGCSVPHGFLKNNHGVACMEGRLFRVYGGIAQPDTTR